MNRPFIIYALPRSRTAWLSNFLTYGDWFCGHEKAINMRNLEDVKAYFSRPNVGAVETAAAQGYYLLRYLVPNIREIVILRPVNEVVDSIMNMDVSEVATYDRDILQRNMEYGDRMLRKIARSPNVLSLNYSDLDDLEKCKEIFEHCLPYKFDQKWWRVWKDRNIQVDVKKVLSYYIQNRSAIEEFKRYSKVELRKLCRMGKISTRMRAQYA